ncbi:MAG: lipoprotein [Gammaproteobacteria bacterium]|jgi:predicted small lipoprotein YifL|nr:lipoprotein [Gammaproteobacteria bacterium]
MKAGAWQCVSLAAVAALVASCGLKGDLYLEEPPPADAAAQSAPAGDEADEADEADAGVAAP